MFQVGDVIEPQEGQTPLLNGHYKVIRIGPDIVHLSRLPTEEETAILVNTNRTTYIPVALMENFRPVPLAFEGNLSNGSGTTSLPRHSTLLAGKRIVIVEDETLLQVQFHRYLTRAGLQVVGQSVTGEEGLVLILEEKPDLVLIEIALPGMDGIEVTRHVMAELSTMVVMATAYDVRKYGQRSFEAGACGYLSKPITAEQLIAEIERCYAARTQTASDAKQSVPAPRPETMHYDYETLQEDMSQPDLLSAKQATGWKILYTYIQTERTTRRRIECYLLQRPKRLLTSEQARRPEKPCDSVAPDDRCKGQNREHTPT